MDRLTPSPCRRLVAKTVAAGLVLLVGIALGCGPRKLEPQEEATAPDQPGEAGVIAYLKRKGVSLQRDDETTLRRPVEPYWRAHVRAARLSNADFKWFQQIGNLKVLGLYASSTTDQGLAAVAGLDRLEWLLLSNLSEVSDAGIDRLTDLGTLQTLSIRKMSISDAALKRFGRLQKLKRLELWDVLVTGAGFAALAGLKGLEELDLSGSPIEDAGCAELVRLPALKSLNLASTRVGNEGVRLLSSSPTLERLTLSYTRISDEAMRHIPAFPRLSGLELSYTAISDQGLAHLRTSKLTSLGLLFARHPGLTDQGLRHLGQIKTLKRFSFDPEDTGVTEDGLRELRRALPDLQIQRLRRLEK